MQPFDYYRPETFEEAFKLLTLPDKTVYAYAGATDMIPAIRDGVIQPDAVLDVKALPDLTRIRIEQAEPCCGCAPGRCLTIGAAAKMADIAASDLVRQHAALMARAAYAMGNEQVRHRATLGGNICTASPAADSAPALYVLEAFARVKGPQGDRSIPIDQVFVGPKRNGLRRDEILVGVIIPILPEGTLSHHEKLARRKTGDLAIVNLAALAMPKNGDWTWRIALGAVGPTPRRAYESEKILAESLSDEAVDRAAAAAYGCASPIADIRSGLEYRQAMIVNLTRRAIVAIRDRLPSHAAGGR